MRVHLIRCNTFACRIFRLGKLGFDEAAATQLRSTADSARVQVQRCKDHVDQLSSTLTSTALVTFNCVRITKASDMRSFYMHSDHSPIHQILPENRHACTGMDFQYRDPDRGFDRAAVKGVVAKLVRIKDPATTTALEVAAGGKLYQVRTYICAYSRANCTRHSG